MYSATVPIILFLAAVAVAQRQRVVVQPQDTGEALINPGMGWQFQHYDNDIRRYTVDLEPSDAVEEFPGVSSVYIRLAWSYVEPEEGKFDWSLLDTAMQRWVSKGKQVSFRFSCSEGRASEAYATPKWVEMAGAKGYRVERGKVVENSPVWEPDFDDPIFLKKLDNFLAALAARYDGHPDVAFIDVGSFGVWGEGHTFSSSGLPYTAATIKRHIDLHLKHFKKTLIVANDDFAGQGKGLETLSYARDKGLGLRDDSILVQGKDRAYYHAYLAHDFWPRVPVVLECEHFGGSKQRGAWEDGSLYLKAVEDYHASYATVHWYPREFLKENRDLIGKINMRLGYRLQLLEASWPSEAAAGAKMEIGYRLRNAGVAPCLPGGHPTLTFKDAKGGVAAVFVDSGFNVRALPVGAPGQAMPVGRVDRKLIRQESMPYWQVTLPPPHILKPGSYGVYVSVGDVTGRPVIALPLPDGDGSRRYRLGQITVR
jgi:hypothetical protein